MLVEQEQWVLRSARMHADDPHLRTAAGFAAGAGVAPPVHRAQVGRWENGAVEVTHDLVRRYEKVLGLPEGQLLCVIDHFSRDVEPVRSTATLVPRGKPDVEETLELIERASGPDRMDGADWDRLSGNLGRMPHAMVRRADWERLIRRAAEETAVSVGLAFAQRDEAVGRLAGHPRSGPVVAALVRDVLADPRAQIYTDPVGLLQYTDHPEAVGVLLTQLRDPANDDALRACLFALTTLVGGGRVPEAVARAAAHLAVEHLRDATRPFRVHRGAASLLRALDVPGLDRLAYGLTDRNRRFVASILREGRALDSAELRGVQRRVRQLLEEGTHPEDAHEPVLTQVVATALGDTHEERRSNALAILMLSPQGRVVGAVYAAELRRAVHAADRVAVHECLAVLSWLGQPEDLDLLTSLACSATVASDLAMEAGVVVGNCVEPHGPARAAREERLHDRLAELLRPARHAPRSAPEAATEDELAAVRERLRGLAYALGMRGRFDLLGELAGVAADGAPGLDDARRALACDVLAWWLALPGYARPVP